jgi:hypothetical protein
VYAAEGMWLALVGSSFLEIPFLVSIRISGGGYTCIRDLGVWVHGIHGRWDECMKRVV